MTTQRKTRRLPPPEVAKPHERQLWRIVEGAVRDAFNCHPDYLTKRGEQAANARRSVTKRVVRSLSGFVEQSTEGHGTSHG